MGENEVTVGLTNPNSIRVRGRWQTSSPRLDDTITVCRICIYSNRQGRWQEYVALSILSPDLTRQQILVECTISAHLSKYTHCTRTPSEPTEAKV